MRLKSLLVFGWGVMALTHCASAMEPLRKDDRVVFIGDSITDGFTYPLMIQQALVEAGQPVPKLINAGVASDTAELVVKRLERDVLSQKPTLALLSIGVNDALRDVKVESYEASVKTIAERLKKENIPLIILTTTILGEPNAQKEKRLDEFNAFLRSYAAEQKLKVADVNALMQAARKNGDHDSIMPDHVHLTYHGYEFMTRAVLDALGLEKLTVPKELKPPIYEGLITHWKFTTAKDPLTEKTVAAVAVENSWKDYELPEKKPVDGWWMEHERQRGTAISLDKEIGSSQRYIGFSILDEKAPRKVTFHVGASLDVLWLNGQRIYKASDWRGWHLDRERATAELKAGQNQLVIETGGQFILTMDDAQ